MKADLRLLEIDKYEYGMLLNSITCFINQIRSQNEPTDPLEELLIKIKELPIKKKMFNKLFEDR